MLTYPLRRNGAWTSTTLSCPSWAGASGGAQFLGDSFYQSPLGYLQLCSSSCLPWVCIPSRHTSFTASIAALPPPDNTSLCPSCDSHCSAAWDKNMQQSRKSNLQKKKQLKRRAQKAAGTEPVLNGRAERQVLRKMPARPPTWSDLPQGSLRLGPAATSRGEALPPYWGQNLSLLGAPIPLTKLGHKIRIWPSLFPGGPFLLEDFLSVEGQHEHCPTHSTQQDLKTTHDMCPATQDILSQSYVLYIAPSQFLDSR